MKRQFAILHLLIGGSLLFLFLFAFGVGAAETVSSAGEALLILAFVTAFPVASFLGGIAMLRNRRSGEVMLKVVSVMLIFLFPLGTLLGAFGLWVLIWDPTAIAAPGRRRSAAHSSDARRGRIGRRKGFGPARREMPNDTLSQKLLRGAPLPVGSRSRGHEGWEQDGRCVA